MQHKTFTEAVADKTAVAITAPVQNLELPSLSRAGTFQAVKINSNIYRKRLALCQHSLIARVILNKGESP